MNKSVLKNGNIYPPFLESGPMPPAPRLAWRNPQGVLPVSAVPRFAIASSVDTHAHVFERGLPMPDARRYAPDEDALLGTYLHHLDTHGMAHGVLVQPSFLGTDNSYLLQALRAQPQRLRGVAVVDESTGDEQLQALADAGVVGMRLNLIGLPLPDLNAPGWRRVLEQANTLGWHVELHLQAGRLPDLLPALLAAGCPVVVYHFRPPYPPPRLPARPWAGATRALAICCSRPAAAVCGSSCPRPTASGRPPTAPPRAGRPPRNCCRPSRPGGCSGAATGRTRSTPARPAIRRPCAGCRTGWTMPAPCRPCWAAPPSSCSDSKTTCQTKETHHEFPVQTNPQPVGGSRPAFGRCRHGRAGRCGCSGCSGQLPRAPRHPGRNLSAGRHRRCGGAPDRPQAVCRAGPARGDREPGRGRRHDWRCPGGQIGRAHV